MDNNANRLNYAQIKGSPFFSNEWQVASLFVNNKLVATVPTRLNMATKQIHFLKNNEELAIQNNDITRVVFYNKNDSVVFMRLPELFVNKKKLSDFVR